MAEYTPTQEQLMKQLFQIIIKKPKDKSREKIAMKFIHEIMNGAAKNGNKNIEDFIQTNKPNPKMGGRRKKRSRKRSRKRTRKRTGKRSLKRQRRK